MPELPDDEAIDRVREEVARQMQARGDPRVPWIDWAALTAAVLAVLAALAGALANSAMSQSILAQSNALDQWSHYEAALTRSAALEDKIDLLLALAETPSQRDLLRMAQLEAVVRLHHDNAEAQQKASRGQLRLHEMLLRSISFFHVAIAVVAIAVLIKLRTLWYLSLAFSLGGLVFLGFALVLPRPPMLALPEQPSAEMPPVDPAAPPTRPAPPMLLPETPEEPERKNASDQTTARAWWRR